MGDGDAVTQRDFNILHEQIRTLTSKVDGLHNGDRMNDLGETVTAIARDLEAVKTTTARTADAVDDLPCVEHVKEMGDIRGRIAVLEKGQKTTEVNWGRIVTLVMAVISTALTGVTARMVAQLFTVVQNGGAP